MTVDEIVLVALAPISAIIFSLYAYRVYILNIPSDNDVRKSKYGNLGSFLMRQVKIFIYWAYNPCNRIRICGNLQY